MSISWERDGLADHNNIVITRLGAKGDGCADDNGQQIFVPFGLPGETWQRQGESWQRLSDSNARVDPPCQHFGTCGGCVAQHMSGGLYREWKLSSVRQTFAHQGITVEPVLSEPFPMASRRRCAFSAKKTKAGLDLGFLVARSHVIVDLASCSVLLPEITNKLADLRELSAMCCKPNGAARIDVLATATGLDVSVEGDVVPLKQELRVDLAKLVAKTGLARLIVDGHEIAQLQAPVITCSGVDVAVHPQAFLQAVEAAEVELATLVSQHVGRAKIVGDLFCGIGTFSFALARKTKVVAFDSDRPSIETLCAARDKAQKLKPIDARVRDLFREPLSRKELDGFDAVVFDPPRAGAEGQSRMLAKSSVARVVAVSCNPATLARDVRLLLDGGYVLESVNCVDQFRFSAHIECVAVLSKAVRRRR